MDIVRQTMKPVSVLMAIFLLMISGPFQSAFAAMIGTESVLDTSRGQEAREFLQQFLTRQDVKNALISQGIEPQEAKARIESLSDAEAVYMAEKMEQLPAGGDFFVTLIIILFIVFIILLITDIAGYTDIFPFVKSKR